MKTPQKFNYSKEWFIENYTNSDKSLADIAKIAGCSYKIAHKWLHKYEIPAKPRMRKALDNLVRYKKGNTPWNQGLGLEDDRVKKAVTNSKITRVLRGSTREDKHYRWSGDDIGYTGLHKWVYRHKGKAEKCVFCGSTTDIQWANKDGKYRRNLDDFIELCRTCHTKYDLGARCNKGHLYTEENTYIRPSGWRSCRQCNKDQYYKRKEVKE